MQKRLAFNSSFMLLINKTGMKFFHHYQPILYHPDSKCDNTTTHAYFKKYYLTVLLLLLKVTQFVFILS